MVTIKECIFLAEVYLGKYNKVSMVFDNGDSYLAIPKNSNANFGVEILKTTGKASTVLGEKELLELTNDGNVVWTAEDGETSWNVHEEEPAIPELGNLLFGNSRGKYHIERNQGREDLLDKLFDKAGLDMYGYVEGDDPAHETELGGFENGTFLVMPYYWGEDEEIAALPNFVHKPSGYEIQWYKYPLRDAYENRKISLKEFERIINDCIRSLK